uniref:ATP synthase subunit a n=1 Tax=Eulimnogammarus verrucosus TaxID=36941 RepID=V5QDE9_EULVE|nr:ATP synthase F0 subunit 6 [Eulimnogammarus verrucosus]AHB14318.1 ATP synthase F0 subunit 6 [Eulimnogammarus verrucosus]
MMTNLFSIFDPSAPNLLFSNWVSVFLFILLVPSLLWKYPSRPKFMSFVLTTYIFKEFKPLIKKSSYFLIFPVSFFTFIVYNNLLGLAPYIFTGTSQLVFTVTMALPIWLTLMIYGWLNNTSNLLIHLIPQSTPVFLMPFMVLVETVSNMIRPLTLAVRLTANMVAGHLLIVLLNSTDLSSILLTPVVFSAKQMLLLLELAVAFIQAYVFSVLVTLYASEFTN